eukprot:m.181138 g.181138  ORF g.181138 m.181138 type:complete len:663 (+) comp21478_c0_seq4:191-2179(+)
MKMYLPLSSSTPVTRPISSSDLRRVIASCVRSLKWLASSSSCTTFFFCRKSTNSPNMPCDSCCITSCILPSSSTEKNCLSRSYSSSSFLLRSSSSLAAFSAAACSSCSSLSFSFCSSSRLCSSRCFISSRRACSAARCSRRSCFSSSFRAFFLPMGLRAASSSPSSSSPSSSESRRWRSARRTGPPARRGGGLAGTASPGAATGAAGPALFLRNSSTKRPSAAVRRAPINSSSLMRTSCWKKKKTEKRMSAASCNCELCREWQDALRRQALCAPLPEDNAAQEQSMLRFWEHAIQCLAQRSGSVKVTEAEIRAAFHEKQIQCLDDVLAKLQSSGSLTVQSNFFPSLTARLMNALSPRKWLGLRDAADSCFLINARVKAAGERLVEKWRASLVQPSDRVLTDEEIFAQFGTQCNFTREDTRFVLTMLQREGKIITGTNDEVEGQIVAKLPDSTDARALSLSDFAFVRMKCVLATFAAANGKMEEKCKAARAKFQEQVKAVPKGTAQSSPIVRTLFARWRKASRWHEKQLEMQSNLEEVFDQMNQAKLNQAVVSAWQGALGMLEREKLEVDAVTSVREALDDAMADIDDATSAEAGQMELGGQGERELLDLLQADEDKPAWCAVPSRTVPAALVPPAAANSTPATADAAARPLATQRPPQAQPL